MTSEVNFNTWRDTAGNMQGTVLQVKHTVKRDVWSGGGSGTTWYSVTGLSATIATRSAQSKVLVIVKLHAGTQYWELQGKVQCNNGDIGLGDARGVRPQCGFAHLKYDAAYDYYDWFPMHYTYLHSPGSIGNQTYQVWLNGYGGNTIYINRTHNDQNSIDYMGCPVSTITLMEIAA
jgi:hypothetical protein